MPSSRTSRAPIGAASQTLVSRERARPLLLNIYSSGDSLPVTPLVAALPKSGLLVRGEEPGRVHLDGGSCPMPPLPGEGYRSVFDRK